MNNLLSDIIAKKKETAEKIAKAIREFEDEFPGWRIEEITHGRYPNPQFNNYGKTWVDIQIKVPTII